MRKHLLVALALFMVAIGAVIVAHPSTSRQPEVASAAENSTPDRSPRLGRVDVAPSLTTTTTSPPATTPPTTAAKPRTTTSTSAPAAAHKPAGAARTTSGGGGVEAFLECVAGHESGHSDVSHNSHGSGGYYGIMVATWHSYGQSGYPYTAPHALQHQVALEIYADRGPLAWSTRHFCGA